MTTPRDLGCKWRLMILTNLGNTDAKILLRRFGLFLSLAPLVFLLGSSGAAWTQSSGGTESRRESQHFAMRGSVDERVARLTKVLRLDEAQQSIVKKILEQRRQEFWRIHRDPSISGSQRIDRVRALQQITVEQIRAVLNDDQKTKYDPLAVRRLDPAPGQRTVEDWLKQTMRP